MVAVALDVVAAPATRTPITFAGGAFTPWARQAPLGPDRRRPGWPPSLNLLKKAYRANRIFILPRQGRADPSAKAGVESVSDFGYAKTSSLRRVCAAGSNLQPI